MVDKETVRQGYDALGETYAAQRSPPDGEIAILEAFVDSLSRSAQMLDAGCGQGGPVLDRVPAGVATVGVDLSRGQLARAAETAPGAALVEGDIANLPLERDSFDAIVAFHSLIHVPGEQHQQVVDEFARVLRPGGRILLSAGTGPWRGTNQEWLGSDAEMSWTIAGEQATRDQLRAAGFSVIDRATAVDELADDDAQWVFLTAELT